MLIDVVAAFYNLSFAWMWVGVFAGESLTGHLPVLFLDGKPLIETNAILRRLSKRLQQYGTDEERDYRVDAVVDASEDFRCRQAAASVPCLSSIDALTSHLPPHDRSRQ
jgi:hypothetical protein